MLENPEGELTVAQRNEVRDFKLKNGILYKCWNDKLLYVVPNTMRKSLLVRFHDGNGHPAIDRTLSLILQRYYFPNMRRYAKQHIRACFQCLACKTLPGRQAGELHPIPPGKRPFYTAHIDHVGPFIRSSRSNKYILVLVDNLTKFVVLKATRDTKATNVINMLEDFVCDFGAPHRIVSDRGTCFTSTSFGDFCSRHGILHTLTLPRHAQTNGQVERVNDCKDWDASLKRVQRNLNEMKSAATGRSPFEALYGYCSNHDEGWLRLLASNDEHYDANHELWHQGIAETIVKAQECMKRRYDLNRALSVRFQVGDLVFFKVNPVATGESTKLQPKAKGPFAIAEVLPSDTYRIASINSDRKGRRYSVTAHATQLRIWVPQRDEYDDADGENESPEEGDQIADQCVSHTFVGRPSGSQGALVMRRSKRKCKPPVPYVALIEDD